MQKVGRGATNPVQRQSGGCSRDGKKTGPSVQRVQKMVEVLQIAFSKTMPRFLFVFFEVFGVPFEVFWFVFFLFFCGFYYKIFCDVFRLFGCVNFFYFGVC